MLLLSNYMQNTFLRCHFFSHKEGTTVSDSEDCRHNLSMDPYMQLRANVLQRNAHHSEGP